MSEAIDIIKLVRELPSRPRGRAGIVLTHEHRGQKEWAAELAQLTGSAHIDLLDCFSRDKTLSGAVAQFSVSRLFEFLGDHTMAPVLVVSGMEFLKATWSGQPNTGEQFGSCVETWSRKPSLLFVVQYDRYLAERKFRRFPQYTFVVDQRETLAL